MLTNITATLSYWGWENMDNILKWALIIAFLYTQNFGFLNQVLFKIIPMVSIDKKSSWVDNGFGPEGQRTAIWNSIYLPVSRC